MPEAYAKPLLAQPGDMVLGIRKAISGKPQIAVPVFLKPCGIQVQHIGRDPALTQFVRNCVDDVPGQVAISAHPEAEAPDGGSGENPVSSQ